LICINRCPACTLLAKTPMWARRSSRRAAIHSVERAGLRLADLETDDLYRRENGAVRDAAKGLSALRNAEALLETHARLQVRFADEVDWRRLVGVRRALVARRAQLADDGTLPRRIAAFGEELGTVRDRLLQLPLADLGFDDLAPGFERAYRRGRKAMRSIDAAPSDARFHAWRKRAKDHRYHLELLRDLWPAQVKARRAEVRIFGDLLGDEHDAQRCRPRTSASAMTLLCCSTWRSGSRGSCAQRCGRSGCGCTPSGRKRWCSATDATGRHGRARPNAARSAKRPDGGRYPCG
jgi:CHAD domain-containing protein